MVVPCHVDTRHKPLPKEQYLMVTLGSCNALDTQEIPSPWQLDLSKKVYNAAIVVFASLEIVPALAVDLCLAFHPISHISIPSSQTLIPHYLLPHNKFPQLPSLSRWVFFHLFISFPIQEGLAEVYHHCSGLLHQCHPLVKLQHHWLPQQPSQMDSSHSQLSRSF